MSPDEYPMPGEQITVLGETWRVDEVGLVRSYSDWQGNSHSFHIRASHGQDQLEVTIHHRPLR